MNRLGGIMEKRIQNRSGFTVMEMVVAIGILGILVLIAAPNLLAQRPNMKVKATARDIYSAFQHARLEAVEENETVVVTFTPGAFSDEGGIGSYRLFVDDGAGGGTAGNQVQDGGEASLMTVAMPQAVSLISAAFTDGSVTVDEVGFTGQGLPADSFYGNVEVRTRTRWYRINLSVSGTVSMEQSDDGINWS
jgi:type IV fimbrial biogenesis protein FimT